MIEHVQGSEANPELSAQKHIGCGGEIVAQSEILVDDLDPGLASLERFVKRDGSAIDGKGAVAGAEVASNDFDERRLAGAIISHQAHDLAALQRHRDVSEGLDRTETL